MKNEANLFLLVSGICEKITFLTDKKLLSNVLRDIPKIIGMNVLRNPIISEAHNNPGLEGYVPIDESNVTISTYTKNARFVACIHSCKYFNIHSVVNYLKKKFSCHKVRFLICYESEFRDKYD